MELINNIQNIDKYPYVNKGINCLIEQLINTQKEDLYLTFRNIAQKVKNEINNNKKLLRENPFSMW